MQNNPSSHVVPFVLFGCVHAVPLQTSFVQKIPSSVQAAPVRGVKTHPVAVLQLLVVHSRPSSQTIAVPWQTAAAVHVSPVVHALLSLHGLPVAGVFEQPVTSLQLSLVHWLVSMQFAVPPTHAPA